MSNLKFSKKLLADFASDILISDIKAYIAEHAEEFAEFKAAHTGKVEISVIGGMKMDVLKIKLPVDIALGSTNVILVGARTVYEYIDDQKTDKIVGTAYEVVCPKLDYEHVMVKTDDITPVLTTEDAHGTDEPVIVSFEGFEGKFYYDKTNRLQLSCKAIKIVVH